MVNAHRIAVQKAIVEEENSLRFDELERLLDPAPMALEMGFERLPVGFLHVAIRTDMNSCTGAMFKWWFSTFRPLEALIDEHRVRASRTDFICGSALTRHPATLASTALFYTDILSRPGSRSAPVWTPSNSKFYLIFSVIAMSFKKSFSTE